MSAVSQRRALLGAAAIGSLSGVTLGFAPHDVDEPAEQDPHVEWVRECFAARHRALGLDYDSPDGAAAWAQFELLRDRILATPAKGLAGSLARLAVVGDFSFGCSLAESELAPPVAEAMALLGVRDWSAP